MKAKFTPGPWEVNKRAKMNVRTVGDIGIATCGGVLEYEQACENAKLVAAAPDLYEALDGIVQYGLGKGWLDGFNGRSFLIEKAINALAKARGENQQQ